MRTPTITVTISTATKETTTATCCPAKTRTISDFTETTVRPNGSHLTVSAGKRADDGVTALAAHGILHLTAEAELGLCLLLRTQRGGVNLQLQQETQKLVLPLLT